MAKEIELKILDVDKRETMSRLRKFGAKRIGTLDFKRVIFFVKKSSDAAVWLRLRTDGKRHTLTLKEQYGSGLSQTNEYETEVKDFREAARILCRSFNRFVYEENKRIEYSLDGIEITLDKWPYLPWLVEIEGKTEKEVMGMYKRLGIKGRPVGNINASKAYSLYGLDFERIAGRNRKKILKLIE